MLRWNGNGGRPPRLLIADRQPLVASALAALVTSQGFDVTEQARTGAEADAAMVGSGIDLAIFDIDLVDPGPTELLDRLRSRGQRLPVIITAPGPEHPALTSILESSADGLVLKCEPPESLFHCLSTVTAGGQWFDRLAMSRALERVQALNGAATLTRRERDVARLVATGQRNRDIAGALGISEGTVKMHLHNVYSKLGLESRTQLAMDERLRMLG
ncbi:MAG: response regulator transcription factor [Polymorphobacter sp.]